MINKKQIPVAVGCFLTAGAILAYMQFATPYLAGYDGYYHIKMARLTLEQGIPIEFPYLPLTIIDSARFLDMHMLFHVFQAPFTWFGDLLLAAKVSTVVFAALTFTLIAMLLSHYGVRFPLLWVLLLFAVSSGFLYRIEMPRTPVFGLVFMLLAFHTIMARKPWHLALVSILFVWTYKGFPILVPLVGFGIFVHFIAGRTIEYRLAIGLAAGIAAGLVLNPYFPNNINFLWDDLVLKIFSEDYATNVGGEWFSYDTWELIYNTFGGLLMYLGGMALTNRDEWKNDRARLFWFLVATMWLVMLIKSRRFVEYFPPCALIFFAFSVRAWLRDLSLPRLAGTLTVVPVAALAGFAVWSIFHNVSVIHDDLESERPSYVYEGGAKWLMENTPPGSRVFHTDWDDFPMLFFHNSHNTYIVGLDPDYMRVQDEDMYDLWSDISVGEVPRPAKLIRETFGAGYVITDKNHDRFIRVARRDSKLKSVYSDRYTKIYQVLD